MPRVPQPVSGGAEAGSQHSQAPQPLNHSLIQGGKEDIIPSICFIYSPFTHTPLLGRLNASAGSRVTLPGFRPQLHHTEAGEPKAKHPFHVLSSSPLKEEITIALLPRAGGRIKWANIWKELSTEPGTSSQLL